MPITTRARMRNPPRMEVEIAHAGKLELSAGGS
jgi:hypothetical protein